MSEKNRNINPKIKLLALLGAVIVSIAILVPVANKWMASNTVKKINVVGNSMIPESEITGRAGNGSGRLDTIQERVSGHPFVEETYVTQNRLEQINIEIKEKTPIAYITAPDGNLSYIDRKGTPLPYRLYEQYRDLPVLRNIYDGKNVDFAAYRNALAIIDELRVPDHQAVCADISEIVFNTKTAEFSLITSDTGTPVLLGEGVLIPEKIEKMAIFWRNRLPNEIRKKYKYIDLRWQNQVVVA